MEERIIFRMRRSLLFSFHQVQEVMHRYRQSAKELSPVSCDLFNKPLCSCKGPENVIPCDPLVRDESRLGLAFLLEEDPIGVYFLKSSFTLLYKQMYFKKILAKAPYRKLNSIQC